jgi:hypothetical protein
MRRRTLIITLSGLPLVPLAVRAQSTTSGLAAALPHIRAGRVRALAVTGAARHPLLKINLDA